MANQENSKSLPNRPARRSSIPTGMSDKLPLESEEPKDKKPTRRLSKKGDKSLTYFKHIKHDAKKDVNLSPHQGHKHTKHKKHVPHNSYENPGPSPSHLQSKQKILKGKSAQAGADPGTETEASPLKLGTVLEAFREQERKETLTRPYQLKSEVSSVDFNRLMKRNQSVVAGEIKNILLADSNVTVVPDRKAQWKKEQAAILEERRREVEDEDTPEEGCPCTCACCRSKHTQEITSPPKDEKLDDELTFREKVMFKFQKAAKWGVVLIGVMDFCMAIDDVYEILLRQMRFEFFFVHKIYNCNVYLPYGYMMLLVFHVIHGLLSLLLLFMVSKQSAGFGLYWIISQVVLFYAILVQGFFRSRFQNKKRTSYFVSYWGPKFAIDLVQLFIVGFRFYKLYNPFHLRLRELAASATTDRSMNNELHLRTSPFLQSKAAVRQAATFETLAVYNKMKELHHTTGQRPETSVVQEEIDRAIQLLNDRSKYPKRKIIHDIAEEFRLEAVKVAQEQEMR